MAYGIWHMATDPVQWKDGVLSGTATRNELFISKWDMIGLEAGATEPQLELQDGDLPTKTWHSDVPVN